LKKNHLIFARQKFVDLDSGLLNGFASYVVFLMDEALAKAGADISAIDPSGASTKKQMARRIDEAWDKNRRLNRRLKSLEETRAENIIRFQRTPVEAKPETDTVFKEAAKVATGGASSPAASPVAAQNVAVKPETSTSAAPMKKSARKQMEDDALARIARRIAARSAPTRGS